MNQVRCECGYAARGTAEQEVVDEVLGHVRQSIRTSSVR